MNEFRKCVAASTLIVAATVEGGSPATFRTVTTAPGFERLW
jgi:hypothetical protein